MKKSPKHFSFVTSATGDRIYALPVIRHMGGGIIHGVLKEHISFFKKQPYIIDAKIAPHPNSIMLAHNIFRKHALHVETTRPKQTLVEMQFLIHHLPLPKLNEIIPWLTSNKLNYSIPIVVHRSPRYRDKIDWSFLKKFNQIICVGSRREAHFFVSQYRAQWIRTKTLEQLATVINSATIFIGNQSMPLSIATGLGKTRMIEECKNIPHLTKRKNRIISYYKTLGNPYPLADCTFNSENEFIMTSNAEINYKIVKAILDEKIEKIYV